MSQWEDEEQFEKLLGYLRQNRSFDFTGYKRPSLMRRVSLRAQILHLDSFADYIDYLEVRPEEFSQLFNTVLINVTSFFRDPPVWECLAHEVLPGILREKKSASLSESGAPVVPPVKKPTRRRSCSLRRWELNPFASESKSTPRILTKMREGADFIDG